MSKTYLLRLPKTGKIIDKIKATPIAQIIIAEVIDDQIHTMRAMNIVDAAEWLEKGYRLIFSKKELALDLFLEQNTIAVPSELQQTIRSLIKKQRSKQKRSLK